MGQICNCTPLPKDNKKDKLLENQLSAETRGKIQSSSSSSKMPLPSINPTCLTKYAKAVLKCDLSHLSKNQQQALLKLREATCIIDEIYVYQCTGKTFR